MSDSDQPSVPIRRDYAVPPEDDTAGVSGDPDGGAGPDQLRPVEVPVEDEPGLLKRLHLRAHSHPVSSLVTKVVVTCVGVSVLCAGLIMMVTPGPGIVGIVLGLAILALEWSWAEGLLDKAREKARQAKEHAESLDPAVRRRRLALTVLAVVVVAGAVGGYLHYNGWPSMALTGWDWAQARIGWLPELPLSD